MATAARKAPATRGLLSIGQVLAKVSPDFPDLTPSKLRFLEEQGLITPERTPSGYRKFSVEHVDHLPDSHHAARSLSSEGLFASLG
jgi:DNA-binding transcriptional MerR regulator